MNEREALKLALEALEVATTPLAKDRQEVLRAQAAIREALAQPEQKPVAHTLNCVCGAVWDIKSDGSEEMAHTPDTTPPHRKPLMDEEIDKLPWEPHEGNPMTFAEGLRYFARAIEAAHGIKE